MNNIKDYRKDELRAYVIGNVLVALLLHGWLTPKALKTGPFPTLISSAIISSVVYIYTFILDSVVPAGLKDWFVYVFTGRPGDTIFTEIKKSDIDARFTKEAAVVQYADVYARISKATSDDERYKIENSSWYAIYKRLEEKPSVYVAQRDFLLCRDMSFMTLDIAVVYLFTPLLRSTFAFSCRYWALLCVEFLLTNLAARGRAKKFVMNVIASDIHIENKD